MNSLYCSTESARRCIARALEMHVCTKKAGPSNMSFLFHDASAYAGIPDQTIGLFYPGLRLLLHIHALATSSSSSAAILINSALRLNGFFNPEPDRPSSMILV